MKSPFLSKKIQFAIAVSVLSSLPLCRAADDTYKGTPYGGKPQEIPGVIQTQNYDVSPGNAMDIAYHRKGAPKAGAARTTGDCIGFGPFDKSHFDAKGQELKESGYYVGYTDAGDWWRYTVKVNDAGTYDLATHIAAGNGSGGKISITFTPVTPAGEPVTTGVINIPTSANLVPGKETYHVWQSLEKLAQIKLAPGLYVMTLKVEAIGGMNFDTFTFTKE